MKKVLFVAAAVALLVAGGAAYASISDTGNVITACVKQPNGDVRIIDPSTDSCKKPETQVTWNKTGPAGTNGVSPAVTQLAAGDSHCPAGGAAITDASGTTAYVCSTQTSGTFTSPNGQFSVNVSDSGVSMVGPNAKISIDSSGNVTVKGQNENVMIGGNETLKVGGNRTEEVSGDEDVKVSASRSETVGASDTVTVGGEIQLNSTVVGINDGSSCLPAARETDLVAGGSIVTGSTTVCIG